MAITVWFISESSLLFLCPALMWTQHPEENFKRNRGGEQHYRPNEPNENTQTTVPEPCPLTHTRTFSRTEHRGHKASLSEFKKTEITPSVFSDTKGRRKPHKCMEIKQYILEQP
jgi:hypothetical protein